MAEDKIVFLEEDLAARAKVIADAQKRLGFLIMANTKHGTQLLTYQEQVEQKDIHVQKLKAVMHELQAKHDAVAARGHAVQEDSLR